MSSLRMRTHPLTVYMDIQSSLTLVLDAGMPCMHECIKRAFSSETRWHHRSNNCSSLHTSMMTIRVKT